MRSTTTYDKCLATELLSSRKYAELLRYIGGLDIKTHSLPIEDIADLYFVQGQCLYRTGEYVKAIIKLKCSVRIANSLNDNLLYARQKATLGQVYFETGRLDEALEAFNESHAFFRRLGDIDRCLLAMEMIALIHFQKGNCAYAIELNESILAQAMKSRASKHVCFASFNLCRVLLWTGNLARVRDLLNSVADDCTDALNKTWLQSLWGTYYVRLLDHDRARKHLATAVTIARKNGYRRDEVVCLEYLGLNEFYEGNYAKAKAYYDQILAMEEITASATAQTLRLMTDVQVALGELDQATETAVRAEEAITKIKEWIELGCLHRSLALLADRRGDAKKATEQFDKALEILNRHGARYEVAATYLVMGRSSCLTADERMEHLLQSAAMFAEMGVRNRTLLVEREQAALSDTSTTNQRPALSSGLIALPTIIGKNKQILDLLSRAYRFAQTDCNILITGETGTGKDLIAQYVHAVSPRNQHKFIVVNSATMPESLLEAELFGACKGSYSGAERDRVGLIAEADGGSFFFDEISETPLFLQAKLLRVVETKVIRRVGDNRDYRCDVRFIAATNCDLWERVCAGRFREDLYYRLRRGHLHIPPLRARMDDIPLLVLHFLALNGHDTFTPEQATLITQTAGLDSYHWQGNVRELQGVIDEAAAIWPGQQVMDLIPILRDILTRLSQNPSPLAERATLAAALNRNAGNKSAAARELGIPVTTLWNQLKKHGIN